MTKCPRCNGNGSVPYHIADDLFDETNCPLCGGSGEIEQTNEEYIRTCSTEELAKLIYKIAVTDVLMDRFFTAEIVNAEIVDVDSGIKEAEAWLKEKHHE